MSGMYSDKTMLLSSTSDAQAPRTQRRKKRAFRTGRLVEQGYRSEGEMALHEQRSFPTPSRSLQPRPELQDSPLCRSDQGISIGTDLPSERARLGLASSCHSRELLQSQQAEGEKTALLTAQERESAADDDLGEAETAVGLELEKAAVAGSSSGYGSLSTKQPKRKLKLKRHREKLRGRLKQWYVAVCYSYCSFMRILVYW